MDSTNYFPLKNMKILASYVSTDASLYLKANETHVTNQLVKTTSPFYSEDVRKIVNPLCLLLPVQYWYSQNRD